MQTRTYTERSNARRAARSAGLDPDTAVFQVEDGFEVRFAPLMEVVNKVMERPAQKPTAEDVTDISWAEMTGTDLRPKAEPLDGIPEFCKIPQEKRRETWIKNPPKVAAANRREAITMAKAKAKEKKAKGATGEKTAILIKMLQGKGSSVDEMTKALEWLPHTLRARISRLPKEDKKIKITRERVDGVTSYRIA